MAKSGSERTASRSGRRSSKKQPSVLNWMGSLILCAIPGVNLIFLILSIIFAKSTSKRAFAIAGLLVFLLIALLVFLAFALFPDFFTRLTQSMRDVVHPAPVGNVVPVV